MGNLPVRHTVMKQLETTLIQCQDVDSTLDGILDQLCVPDWQALSVAKPRLLFGILNSDE